MFPLGPGSGTARERGVIRDAWGGFKILGGIGGRRRRSGHDRGTAGRLCSGGHGAGALSKVRASLAFVLLIPGCSQDEATRRGAAGRVLAPARPRSPRDTTSAVLLAHLEQNARRRHRPGCSTRNHRGLGRSAGGWGPLQRFWSGDERSLTGVGTWSGTAARVDYRARG